MSLTPLVNLPSPSDPANFAAEADNFLTVQLPNLVTEWNADIALFNNQDTRSTSTTSLTISVGSKTLTVETGKMYQPNMTIRIAHTSTAGAYMEGLITSYDSGTGGLVVNVTIFSGSGTLNSWNTFLVPSFFSSNLTFTGTGGRITGDFSNATVVNRVLFQTSTINGNTSLGVLPNGTSTTASFTLFNNSDPTNASFAGISANSTDFRILADKLGTGSYLPMVFYTKNAERLRIDTAGNVTLQGSTGLLGYGTGSGGTVTQATSKSTGVTLNRANGQITMNAAELAASTTVQFTVSNSLVTTNDNIVLTLITGDANVGLNYQYWVGNLSSGAFVVNVRNISGASRSEALVFNFAVLKGSLS